MVSDGFLPTVNSAVISSSPQGIISLHFGRHNHLVVFTQNTQSQRANQETWNCNHDEYSAEYGSEKSKNHKTNSKGKGYIPRLS